MPSPKVELLPLKSIRGWTRNPKLHDLPRIAASIERFGFVAPLVMDATTGRLVAGHGRLEALGQVLDEEGADAVESEDY